MADRIDKRLRFAALIRVSTEKQETQGESLNTQVKQVEESVRQLGGTITRWYTGQEHATAGWERKQLDQLLKDAQSQTPVFDAVIVADPSRWSRDNVKSETGLDILKESNVRFFVLSQEYDLYDAHARLFLGLSSQIGAFQARHQKLKSAQNRIERAKDGRPTCGKLPFGRTYDKETKTWGVDPEKKAMIEEIAKRYLAGEKMSHLAKEFGLNHASIWKTLTQRCGNTWNQSFKINGTRIDERITTKIPHLLPQKTIDAILAKSKANKTYQHGTPKHKYLFSGMVFCGCCGYAMFGQTNHGNRRYYRHAHTQRARECEHRPRPWVNADELEKVVIPHLFDTFGNRDAIQRAIKSSIPNNEQLDQYRESLQENEKELAKLAKARDQILGLIVKSRISEQHAEKRLAEIQEREQIFQEKNQHIQSALVSQPSIEEIRQVGDKVAQIFRKQKRQRVSARRWMMLQDAHDFSLMTWTDKRSLCKQVFSGNRPDGKPNGIYIFPIDGQQDHRKKVWAFELHGMTPLSDERLTTENKFWKTVTQYALHSQARGRPAHRFQQPDAQPHCELKQSPVAAGHSSRVLWSMTSLRFL